MPSTAVAYGGIVLRMRYGMRGTEVLYGMRGTEVCYAMRGTAVCYGMRGTEVEDGGGSLYETSRARRKSLA